MFSSISSVFSSDVKGSSASVGKNNESSLPVISVNESDRSERNEESEQDSASSVVKEPEGPPTWDDEELLIQLKTFATVKEKKGEGVISIVVEGKRLLDRLQNILLEAFDRFQGDIQHITLKSCFIDDEQFGLFVSNLDQLKQLKSLSLESNILTTVTIQRVIEIFAPKKSEENDSDGENGRNEGVEEIFEGFDNSVKAKTGNKDVKGNNNVKIKKEKNNSKRNSTHKLYNENNEEEIEEEIIIMKPPLEKLDFRNNNCTAEDGILLYNAFLGLETPDEQHGVSSSVYENDPKGSSGASLSGRENWSNEQNGIDERNEWDERSRRTSSSGPVNGVNDVDGVDVQGGVQRGVPRVFFPPRVFMKELNGIKIREILSDTDKQLLELRDRSIRFAEVVILCELLAVAGHINYLGLEGNYIDAKAGAYLAEKLTLIPHITTINLLNNPLTNEEKSLVAIDNLLILVRDYTHVTNLILGDIVKSGDIAGRIKNSLQVNRSIFKPSPDNTFDLFIMREMNARGGVKSDDNTDNKWSYLNKDEAFCRKYNVPERTLTIVDNQFYLGYEESDL